MTPPRRRTRILFTVTVLAIALTACAGGGASPGAAPTRDGAGAAGQEPGTGAPGDPVALIRSVSRQVADIGSFRMNFQMAIEARGTSIAATGDGTFSDDPPSMHTTYRFDQLPGMPDGAEMELILDGTTMYMRMPTLAGVAGISTEWVSMDIEEVAPGFDGLLALSQGQNDPTSSLAYLDGITDAEAVGTEEVAGVTTTHYHGTVDPSAAFERMHGDLDANARHALAQARRVLGKASMPVDVWIDDEGLLRRMAFRMESSTAAAGDFSMEMTIEIPEYGIDIELPIPPADEVTDLTELTHQTLGGDY